jgi:putative hydrolase
MTQTLIDIHTHTIVSGHAFCTLNEMVQEAQKHDLALFGITEHGPAIPGTCHPVYFRNLHVVPRQYGSMRLLLGAELNIIDYEGNVDITDPYVLGCMDHVIAGLHSLCYTNGTHEQNTSALIGAIENPYIHIISHPCDGTATSFDIEAVVLAAKRTGTLLELNSSSLNPARHKTLAHPLFCEMLRLCKRHDTPIILGSDAHHTASIADYRYALPLLTETDFPDQLIINDKPDLFLEYITSPRCDAPLHNPLNPSSQENAQ